MLLYNSTLWMLSITQCLSVGAAAVLPSLQHVTLDDLLSFLTAQCDPQADTRILLPELRETPRAVTIAH